MLIPKSPPDYWRLLSSNNIILRKVLPWGGSIQKILWQAQPRPFSRSNLLVSSDYGGEHKGATHRVYAFLIADNTPSAFARAVRTIRQTTLTDGRRLSFKRLDDPARQAAVVPYLQGADTLTGHLVIVAVDRHIKWLFARKGELHRWQKALDLQARWTDQAFEDMARKAYMIALFLSLWSRPMMSVDWVTDQDQSVANAQRLDDAQVLAARFATLLLPHKMGEFSIESTSTDDQDRMLEDMCALPDLAAGMASDVCAALTREGGWKQVSRRELEGDALSDKTTLIADWFWHGVDRLRKTMIQMDRVATGYAVRQIWRGPQ